MNDLGFAGHGGIGVSGKLQEPHGSTLATARCHIRKLRICVLWWVGKVGG